MDGDVMDSAMGLLLDGAAQIQDLIQQFVLRFVEITNE
jgi:hypothetical protein